jgi:hypothetical protein
MINPFHSKEFQPIELGIDITPEGCCLPASTHGIMEWWKNGILGMKS